MDKQRWINLFAAIAAISVFGFTLGLMFPLLSLIMERDGVSPEMIGYNNAMQPLGILLSGFIAPKLVKTFGAHRTAIVAALITAGIVFAYPLLPALGAWFVLRLLHGAAVSTLFSVSEAWIVRYSEGPYRTRLLAVYASILSASFGGGPALIAWTGIDGILPFAIGAAVLAAGSIPILLVREPQADEEESPAMTILSFAPKAPVLLLAVGAFAIIDAANLGLLPVYGVKKGLPQETASFMLTVFAVGNVFLQLPIGWLADHMNKRVVMAGCAIATCLASAAIPMAFGSWMMWPLILVSGAASAGIYTVALAELGERFKGTELVSGTSSFATMWGIGALFGAVMAGWAFDSYGPDGLPYSVALTFAAFIMLIIIRAATQKRVPKRA
ncbi:MAG: MFS transporter [Parvibaculaceae bacterium]